MRVEGNPGLQVATEVASGKRAETKSSHLTLGQAEGQDQATISQQHQRVQSLMARVASAPDVRQEKVAGLTAAVQSGSYQVSAQQTADAMLEQMRRRSG